MNTYADDFNVIFEKLDLKNVMIVDHSTGGGEVVRFLGRHGTSRMAKAVFVSAVPPLMPKTPANPLGLPIEVFDGFCDGMIQNRAQFFIDVPSGHSFGFNRPGANISRGLTDSWWELGMQCGFKNAYDCVKAFSETHFKEDMKKLDIPVLLLHGTDYQVVPIDASARVGIKLLKHGTLKEYPGALNALPNICRSAMIC